METNRQHLRRAVGLAAYLCVAAVLLALVAHFALIRRSTGREIASLESTRDKLRAITDRLETERKQADSDKRVVLNLLGQCRAAEDIPHLRGNRVVARRQGFERLCMYVPEGSHTLEISSTWKPGPTRDTSPDVDADEAGPTGEKTWTVPLLPACGYWLKFVSDRKGGPIQWELTSNHPDFRTQMETVPLDGFSHQGSSWSGSGVVLFPNQIEQFSISRLKAAATSSPGVNLTKATLRGRRHERQYEVRFVVRLLSDGPACVSASGAQSLILGQEDLLLPYKGGGKYEVNTPNF